MSERNIKEIRSDLLSGPTPTPDEYLRVAETDATIFWAIGCGHHLNLFEAAVEGRNALQAKLAQAEARIKLLEDAGKALADEVGAWHCEECGQTIETHSEDVPNACQSCNEMSDRWQAFTAALNKEEPDATHT